MRLRAAKPIRLFWQGIVVAAILWWATGLNLFIYQFAALLLLLLMLFGFLRQRHSIYIPSSAIWIAFLALVYFSSILVHSFDYDLGRVLPAFYNLSFWVMGFCLIVALANGFQLVDVLRYLKSFYI